MNFTNPIFLTLVLGGISNIISGSIMLKHPPKTINSFYGYRTAKAMKDQDTWKFSQIYASKMMIKYGIIITFFSLISLAITMNNMVFSTIIGVLLLITFLGSMIYKIEKAIKKRFRLY